MSAPVVSVVVPSYAGVDRLPALLDGFRNQRFDDDWELVVVLDGLVDDSAELLATVDDLPLRVVELPENRGRPAALNAGFDTARGEVLVRCDDDLGVPPSFLAAHVAVHAGGRGVGAVGLCHDVLGDTPYARCYGRAANDRLRDAAYAADPDEWWRYWAANCSVTRATFDRVGPYDEAFRDYGWEDVDWGYRLHRLGVPVILHADLEVTHHAAATTTAIRVQRAFASGRARARFEAKHGLPPLTDAPRGVTARVWAAARGALARRGSPERFERWGTSVDRRLGRLPTSMGTRLVELLVQSAAAAGRADVADEVERGGG